MCQERNPDGVQCAYRYGHAWRIMSDGRQYDHGDFRAGVYWNDTRDEAPTERCTRHLRREDGSMFRCTYHIGHTRGLNALAPGTDGKGYDHGDPENDVWWNEPAAPGAPKPAAPEPKVRVIRTLDELRDALPDIARTLLDGCGECDACVARAAAKRGVRVRFIELPNVPGEVRTPLGNFPTSTPQGFTLIVDGFRDRAHATDERQLWEEFGDEIGASTTLVYPGTLSIE